MDLQHTKLSNEAMGVLMMCLQKSILEQTDIVPMLLELKFKEANGQLFVLNPPLVKFGEFDEPAPETPQVTNFNNMKASELKVLAKQQNIKGFSKMRKADLVDALNSRNV